MSSNTTVRGIILCLLPPLFWGGMFPIANHLSETVNMFMMTLIRYSIVALILTAMLLGSEGKSSFRVEGYGWRLAALGASGFAGFGLLAFTALSYTSPSNVSLIMAMMPSIGAIIASISAKRLPPVYTVVAIVVAFIGVSLVLTNGDYSSVVSVDEIWGELLALLGAICWVVYTRGATMVPSWSILRYTTITTMLGVPAIAVATIVATEVGYVTNPTLHDVFSGWLELGYLIVFAGVIAVLAWNKGNRIIGSINGTLFMNIVPVTTFTIMAFITATPPPAPALTGMMLVIGGLTLNNFFTRRKLSQNLSKNCVGKVRQNV